MPADRATLAALLERVRACEGADRGLDAQIVCAVLEPWRQDHMSLTGSADAAIALIEADPRYRANPKGFLIACNEAAGERPEWDYRRPAAPQVARFMLTGYLAALLAQGTDHADT